MGPAEQTDQADDQAPVELGLALREGELDVEQAAMAEHGHEHRDLACSRRAMAQPESFSISLRRRISAHKATFMARSSFCQELPRQPLEPLAGTHAEQHQSLARFGAT